MKLRVKITVANGYKISAIKVFRNVFGSGLGEAKDTVEAIIDGALLDLEPAKIVELSNAAALETIERWLYYANNTHTGVARPLVPLIVINLVEKAKLVDPYSGRIDE